MSEKEAGKPAIDPASPVSPTGSAAAICSPKSALPPVVSPALSNKALPGANGPSNDELGGSFRSERNRRKPKPKLNVNEGMGVGMSLAQMKAQREQSQSQRHSVDMDSIPVKVAPEQLASPETRPMSPAFSSGEREPTGETLPASVARINPEMRGGFFTEPSREDTFTPQWTPSAMRPDPAATEMEENYQARQTTEDDSGGDSPKREMDKDMDLMKILGGGGGGGDSQRSSMVSAGSFLRNIGGNFLDQSQALPDHAQQVVGTMYEDTGAGRLAKLRYMFELLDEDGSGEIDINEFCEGLPRLGIKNVTEEDAIAAMNEIDRNANGTLEFDDFVRFFDLWDKAQATEGKTLAKMLREERERRAREDVYSTAKRKDAKERIRQLLYGLPITAPDYGPRRWWDVVIAFVAMYHYIVCTLTAVEPQLGIDLPPVFLSVELVATAVLISDIVICLNTAVFVPGQFKLVVERWLVLKDYVKWKLWIDIAGAIPVDLTYALLGGGNPRIWRLLRLLRVFKLLKLKTLFPMTARGAMDANYVRFYHWYVPLVKTLLTLIFWAHVLALARMVIAGRVPETEECNELGMDRCQDEPWSRWGYALFWMWSLTLGQGLSAMETPEVHAFGALVFLVALLVQGHVMAQMSAIFIKSNVKQIKVDSMRKALAEMKFYGIPLDLQTEVLSFNYHVLEQNAVAPLAETLSLLPLGMQAEVGLFVRVSLVSAVPMFQDLSSECRQALAGCLHQMFVEPEMPLMEYGDVGSEMYFIMHGFADVSIPVDSQLDPEDPFAGGTLVVAVVKPGDFFGEVALLNPGAHRTASIMTLTYCDLFRLDVEDFVALFYRFAELSIKMEAEARNRGLLQSDDKSMTRHNTAMTARTARSAKGVTNDVASPGKAEQSEPSTQQSGHTTQQSGNTTNPSGTDSGAGPTDETEASWSGWTPWSGDGPANWGTDGAC
eukprot:Hpha_TRINITY_DN9205_c0_g3::TRINITY_DN9205_c0_g3_i1::g.28861::m.28861